MNFNNLPGEIKSNIYKINRDIDKHEKLLKKCFSELDSIKFHADQYIDWVIDCVGISVWEHSSDYEYWTNLEFREKIQRKFFLSKQKLVKLLIKIHREI
jgi:hypothetical protein